MKPWFLNIFYLDQVDRKRGRESESGEADGDSGSFDSEGSDCETESSSSGVSSDSGHSSRNRKQDNKWRPAHQVVVQYYYLSYVFYVYLALLL